MNWSYLFKHWFFTLLIGPIVSQIIMSVFDVNSHRIIGLLEIYPITLIFGLFFSTPTYILYALLYFYLSVILFNFHLVLIETEMKIQYFIKI